MLLNNIFISSYSFNVNNVRTNQAGPVAPLLNFFRSKAGKIYLIEQPLPGSDSIKCQLTIVDDAREVEKIRINFLFPSISPKRLNTEKTYIRLKIRDIVANIYFFIKYFTRIRNDKFDMYIGVECINAIFGIFLKKLGFAKKVIYYIFDWAPDRYSNFIMNNIYILLDKIATYYSDYTWNITYTIPSAKTDILGYAKNKMSLQLYVPYCYDLNEDAIMQENEIDTKLIVYSGGLIEENGPQILVKAYKLVLDEFPGSKLIIIGGGGIEKYLKEFVVKNHMGENVQFAGYIADERRIIDIQRKASIGVAPYPFLRGSRKPYGDVIKVRMYFACGLVVVSTPVPPVSREIKEEKLGIISADDTPEEIAKGITLFLKNERLLLEYRKNVIAKAMSSRWEDNFANTLQKMKF